MWPVGFWGCEHAVPSHSELLIDQRLQVLLLFSNHSLPNLCLYLGLIGLRCRTLQLALLNYVRLTQAHLSSCRGPSGCHPFPTPHKMVSVIGKLAECALNPTVHVADKAVKKCWSKNQSESFHSSLLSTWILSC